MDRLTSQAPTSHLTRRQMLQLTAGIGVDLALGGPSSVFAAEPAGLLSLDLTGDMWTMRADGKSQSYPAVVPGSTYTNLLQAGAIPDTFYGENNGKVQWVAEKSWIFRRTIKASAELRAKPHVQLVCHGLDTLATLWLNGRRIGRADNMFRTWTFDVKPRLRKGTNHLRIQFDTLAPYVEKHSRPSDAETILPL